MKEPTDKERQFLTAHGGLKQLDVITPKDITDDGEKYRYHIKYSKNPFVDSSHVKSFLSGTFHGNGSADRYIGFMNPALTKEHYNELFDEFHDKGPQAHSFLVSRHATPEHVDRIFSAGNVSPNVMYSEIHDGGTNTPASVVDHMTSPEMLHKYNPDFEVDSFLTYGNVTPTSVNNIARAYTDHLKAGKDSATFNKMDRHYANVSSLMNHPDLSEANFNEINSSRHTPYSGRHIPFKS